MALRRGSRGRPCSGTRPVVLRVGAPVPRSHPLGAVPGASPQPGESRWQPPRGLRCRGQVVWQRLRRHHSACPCAPSQGGAIASQSLDAYDERAAGSSTGCGGCCRKIGVEGWDDLGNPCAVVRKVLGTRRRWWWGSGAAGEDVQELGGVSSRFSRSLESRGTGFLHRSASIQWLLSPHS